MRIAMGEKLEWKTIGFLVAPAMLLFCVACSTITERHRLFDSSEPTTVSGHKAEDKKDVAIDSSPDKEKAEIKVRVRKEGVKLVGEIPAKKVALLGTGLSMESRGGIPSKKEGISVGKKGIILNYDQAPITQVIEMIGKYLGINYIIDPTVKGTVNLHTYRAISKQELWPVFLKILRINHIGVIESDGLYEIYPLKDSQAYDISIEAGKEVGKGREDLPVIQIIPLMHIMADDVSKVLVNFTTPTGKVVAYPEDNLLVIVDQRWNIRRLMEFIRLFDVSQFSNLTLRMYEIHNVPVVDLTKELEGILKQYGVEDKKIPDISIRLISLERLNALFVISGNKELLEKTEALIQMLDITAAEDVEAKIYVYPVSHADAENLAELLQEILSEEDEEKEEKRVKEGKKINIATEELASAAGKTERLSRPVKKKEVIKGKIYEELGAIGNLKKEIKLIPDTKRNYIIINAIPADYLTIQRLLQQLDIIPRQALIEVMIADITLTDELKLGLEWQSIGGLGSGSSLGTVTAGWGTGLATGIPGTGLSYAIAKTGELSATLRAMAAEDRVNVLSAPSIMTSDNEEASIEISQEIPYLSSTSAVTTVEGGLTQTSTIQYRDTGIILTVKPQISGRGQLKMEISQEVSEKGADGVMDSPIFIKRAANTIVHVYDNQTIAIGGLMRQSKVLANKGVPYLNRLPLIGWLFGYYGEKIEKTELIILITARVIDSLEDIDIVSARFKKRVEIIKQELENYQFMQKEPKLKQNK
jgi:general secretion pathway protein D